MTAANTTQTIEETIKLDDSERQPCEIWTRVMGYYRPVSAWNRGKQSEYQDRTPFAMPPADYPESSSQLKLGI